MTGPWTRHPTHTDLELVLLATLIAVVLLLLSGDRAVLSALGR